VADRGIDTVEREFRTATGMLRQLAGRQGDTPMLTAGERTLTWGQLYRRARRMSQALAANGVAAGDRVAFLDRNGIEYFEVFFGCTLMGAVPVAINWRLAIPELAAIVEDSRASVIFFGADYAATAKDIAAAIHGERQWISLDDLDAWLDTHADPDPGDPGFEPGPDDVVTQLYTSGTTGLPKGAMITARNISCVLTEADRVFHIGTDTVSLVAMPLFHIGGTGWALAGMSRGGHSVIVRDIDPAAVLALVERHRITETFVVPAVLMFMLATPELATADVSSLRTVFYGAAPISEDLLVRSIRALGCDFAQVYGLTETTGAITSLLPEDHDPSGPRSHLLQSAGRPFDHVEIRIVDTDSGADLPVGQVGELWTRSDQNMAGYWEKPEATAAVLSEDGWFRTGDAGWVDAEGYVFLHDRIKDMIVSGGENVYPAEVENALLSHPAVADAAVIGVPDNRWGETVKAIVVRAPGAPEDHHRLAADIIASTRQRLAHYKCPTSVDFVDVLPRNASGKILKRELRQPFWAGRERNVS
jgi:long-chain acyl-CoA synthetase